MSALVDISPIDHFDSLPDEILMNIFSYLDPVDLCNCCYIHKRWKRVSSDNTLWQRYYPYCTPKKGLNLKEIMSDFTVLNEERFVQKLETLLPSDRCKYALSCRFLYEPTRSIRVCFDYDQPLNKENETSDITLMCFEKQKSFKEDFYQSASVGSTIHRIKLGLSFRDIQFTRDKEVADRTFVEVTARDEPITLCNRINSVLRKKIKALNTPNKIFLPICAALFVSLIAYRIFS